MPLTGALSEFSSAELIQMLGLSRKTGVLRVRSKARGFIYFKDGGAFFAVTTQHRKPLGKRLIETHSITKSQLDEALAIQKRESPKRRLGKILVDEGLIDKSILEEFVKEQIWDALSDILSWQHGDFAFETDVMPQEEDIGISFDQWEAARASIPSFDKLFRSEQQRRIERVVQPDVVFCLTADQGMDFSPISLQPGEWKTICLVDGHRTVQDIIDERVLPEDETSQVLYRLYQGGLIELPEEAERHEQPTPEAIAQDAPLGTDAQPVTSPAQPATPSPEPDPALAAAATAAAAAAEVEEIETRSQAPTTSAPTGGVEAPVTAAPVTAEPLAAAAGAAQEADEAPDNGSGTHTPVLEIRSLGPMGLWTREGQKEAQLFAVQKGSDRTTVFLLPNGTYQFKGSLSQAEQEEVIKRIGVLMDQPS